MQLSFDAADRLVELVETRRRPIPAAEAAQVALRARLGADGDRALAARRCRHGRRAARLARCGCRARRCPGGHDAARGRRRSSSSISRRPGSRPTSSRIVEIGAQKVEGLALGATFETLVDPGVRLPDAITALTGIGRDDVRGAPGGRPRGSSLPRLRRRRGARRAQRTVRHGVSRSSRRAHHRPARRGAGRRHGLARAAAARRPHDAVRPAAALALLRNVRDAVPPCARRRIGDRRDPDRADRARAGARRRDGRRPRRARRRREPGGSTASARSSPQRRRPPGRTSSATRGGRRSTSDAPAIFAPGCARTSRAVGSDPPSRRPSARSRASTGSGAGASSRPPSTSFGSSVSSDHPPTRGARGPTGTSIFAAAARAWACVQRSDATRPDQRPRRRPARCSGARRATTATIRARRSRASGFVCGDSQPISASRTPRACAIGSPRSSRSSTGSTSSSAAALALQACLVVPALEPGMVRGVFVAGRCRLAAHDPARRRWLARGRGRSRRTCVAGRDGGLEATLRPTSSS